MNYRQIYARKAECEKRIKEVCPEITNRPGIYIFYRTDTDSGLRFCYIGQAKRLIERCAQHLQEYDHIALSLKKRGFKRDGKDGGWELVCFDFPIDELDMGETEMIKLWANKGYQLFNRTAGGQSDGKIIFDNKRQAKTYREGLAQGYLNARREVAHWFSLHLNVSMKKPTKNAEKALAKFQEFIDLEAEENA
jgi:hypothetical protein